MFVLLSAGLAGKQIGGNQRWRIDRRSSMLEEQLWTANRCLLLGTRKNAPFNPAAHPAAQSVQKAQIVGKPSNKGFRASARKPINC